MFNTVAQKFRSILSNGLLELVDVDTSDIVTEHRKVLLNKKLIRDVFKEFYDLCIEIEGTFFSGTGIQVEVGAGSSLFKHFYPGILSTDIKPAEHLDAVVDVLAMPFSASSVKSIFAINCFHHFPDPSKFFSELDRVLEVGGGAVIIDPYYGATASLIYPHLFPMEHFDKTQKEWTPDHKMTVSKWANQALSYIVFVRDRENFLSQFPMFEIVVQKPLGNFLRYLGSGGVNFKQLIPDGCVRTVKLLENLISPLHPLLALHHVIGIKKIS